MKCLIYTFRVENNRIKSEPKDEPQIVEPASLFFLTEQLAGEKD